MKINKIICDVCHKEINFETDASIAMFEKANLLKKFNLKLTAISNDQIEKTHYDLCDKCSLLVEKYIEKLKYDNNTHPKK